MNRREFLKISSIGSAAVLAACSTEGQALTQTIASATGVPPTETPYPATQTPGVTDIPPKAPEQSPVPKKEFNLDLIKEATSNYLNGNTRIEGTPYFLDNGADNKQVREDYMNPAELSVEGVHIKKTFNISVLQESVEDEDWKIFVWGSKDKNGTPFCYLTGNPLDREKYPHMGKIAGGDMQIPEPYTGLTQSPTRHHPDFLDAAKGRLVYMSMSAYFPDSDPGPVLNTREVVLRKETNSMENIDSLIGAYQGNFVNSPSWIIEDQSKVQNLDHLKGLEKDKGKGRPPYITQATFSTVSVYD